MARTQARMSRSAQSTGVLSATALAIVARTLAESTSYCCAPARASAAAIAATAAAQALIARRRFRIREPRLHVLRGFGERHPSRRAVAAMLVFDHAVLQAALAHDEAVGDADELLVGEEDPRALVAVVEEDFQPRARKLGVELLRGFLHGRALAQPERDHRDHEGRHGIGPDDPLVVVVLLDGGGDDARDPDAVAAH